MKFNLTASSHLPKAISAALYIAALAVLATAIAVSTGYLKVHATYEDVCYANTFCPAGQTPLCVCSGINGETCSSGCLNIGIPPVDTSGYPPTCASQGMTGSWPYCTAIPTCSPYAGQGCSSGANMCGMTSSGTYDCNGNCSAGGAPSNGLCPVPPPPPTCGQYGQLGTYPNCYAPPQPTCGQYGQLGTYPNCYSAPNPTCADSGQTGTYPNCHSAPTCTANDCAANTCSTTTCVDSCGSVVNGTKSCTAPPPPTGCSNPVAFFAATPSRVNSGETATLGIKGTGINGPCTVTGPGVNQQISAASCFLASTSIQTPPITTQSTYTLTCPNDAAAAKSSVIVNINPSFSPF